MPLPDFILRRRRPLILLALAAAALLYGYTQLSREGGSGLNPGQLLAALLEQARRLPFPVFLVLAAALPFAGVPMTALYLAAGATYAPQYGLPLTLAGMSVALLANLLASYSLSRTCRGPATRLLQCFRLRLPSFETMPAWKVILLVRITPGAPLMVQNLLLGLAGAPLPAYLGISLVAETLITLGYLSLGSSFATGRWGLLVTGGGLVLAVLLFTSLLRDRNRLKTSAPPTSEP